MESDNNDNSNNTEEGNTVPSPECKKPKPKLGDTSGISGISGISKLINSLNDGSFYNGVDFKTMQETLMNKSNQPSSTSDVMQQLFDIYGKFAKTGSSSSTSQTQAAASSTESSDSSPEETPSFTIPPAPPAPPVTCGLTSLATELPSSSGNLPKDPEMPGQKEDSDVDRMRHLFKAMGIYSASMEPLLECYSTLKPSPVSTKVPCPQPSSSAATSDEFMSQFYKGLGEICGDYLRTSQPNATSSSTPVNSSRSCPVGSASNCPASSRNTSECSATGRKTLSSLTSEATLEQLAKLIQEYMSSTSSNCPFYFYSSAPGSTTRSVPTRSRVAPQPCCPLFSMDFACSCSGETNVQSLIREYRELKKQSESVRRRIRGLSDAERVLFYATIYNIPTPSTSSSRSLFPTSQETSHTSEEILSRLTELYEKLYQ